MAEMWLHYVESKVVVAISLKHGVRIHQRIGNNSVIRGKTRIVFYAPRFHGEMVETMKRTVENLDLVFLGFQIKPGDASSVQLVLIVHTVMEEVK